MVDPDQVCLYGSLWSCPEAKEPLKVLNHLVDDIPSIPKTKGYLFRFLANYAWCLSKLRQEDIPPDLGHLEGHLLERMLDALPETFEPELHAFEGSNPLGPVTVPILVMTLYRLAVIEASPELFPSKRLFQLFATSIDMIPQVSQLGLFAGAWHSHLQGLSVPSPYGCFFGGRPGRFACRTTSFLWVLCDRYDGLPTSLVPQWLTDLILERAMSLPSPYLSLHQANLKPFLPPANLPFNKLHTLLEQHPEIVPTPLGFGGTEMKQLTPEAWNVLRCSPVERAYILGFPIHLGIPGDRQIRQALFKLSRDGPETYMLEVGRKWDPFVRFETEGLTWVSEKEDSITALPFAHFGPFDRLVLVEDDFAYEFTRNAWANLVKETPGHPPVNPYNRKPLSAAFLASVRSRLEIATMYHLPEPGTLQHLIERAGIPHPQAPMPGDEAPLPDVFRLFNALISNAPFSF